MADLKTKFEKASDDVQKLSKKPDNDTLLKLYSLYKQGTTGDVEGKGPGCWILKGEPNMMPGQNFRAHLKKRRWKIT